MKLRLDEYAELDSPLHRWEPRCKLIALLVLIFAYSFVRDLRLLPVILSVSGALYMVSRLPFSFLLARLRLPGFFLLMVAVLLPFLSGQTVLFYLGPLAVRKEGCLDLLIIAAKFVSILTIGIILFGTTPFLNTIKAMRALGLPPLLADMTLFSYRYIFEFGNDLKAMEKAMRLRGFRKSHPGGLGILASLAGSILVRSYEQAERVCKAMTLRGYGQSALSFDNFRVYPRDLAGLLLILLVAAILVAFEIYLR